MDGDSLWDISEAHPVEGLTTSEVIDLIREENDLFGTVIQPARRSSCRRRPASPSEARGRGGGSHLAHILLSFQAARGHVPRHGVS